ncbi:NAD(P)/FAD-dependent oxidoreductase [Nocardiopsis ansamitocini]|uniref:D-amino-acid dehydrogenase n=1 Tax=Nocardiopsis ansamitocini TaxID=1670832 RepID=A0A9W6P847_9ACTN|nr:FAD-dependent oxidoreductase [Nocardiopsis ansamitocini]GLU48757.1 D-amino-acid dehydrogenase [Nocardiopsis ansamitocini]
MGKSGSSRGEVRTAVVVGAGVVGLSTAWFLQERGVGVTVLDRADVAAGASWGNAGWLSPGLAIPLNEPGILRYGLRTLVDPRAPLYVPPTPDPELWRFLTVFAAQCRWGPWYRAVRANLPLNRRCLDAFDALTAGGVEEPTTAAPVTAGFRSRRAAIGLIRELRRISDSGLDIDYAVLSGDELRDRLPHASSLVRAGVRIEGQRFVDPGAFTRALAASVRSRGGTIRTGVDVVGLDRDGGGTVAHSRDGERITADVAVAATGAWLSRLAAPRGVRTRVRAGRGYSFTVPTDEPVRCPVYLPEARVACTPYRGGLRIAGTMEFRGPDAPLDGRRIEAIVASARPFLTGVRWAERTDEWVGSRPVTPDGRPLIGASATPGVYVAGGHGMWGLTHGPTSGMLLAEEITTGKRPEALRGCDPRR